MNLEIQKESDWNWHYVELPNKSQFKVYNQLDKNKDMCNYFVHKTICIIIHRYLIKCE